MKDFFIGLVTGVFLCALVGGYFAIHKHKKVQHAQDVTASALERAGDAIQAKLEAWHLTGDDIQRELTDTGKVVRRQMSDFGAAVADAAGDAKITGKIKAKFALDKEVSALGIGVSTTDGRVTLSGNVSNSKQIGKAMILALETDGVREVSSTLRVKQ
jgi:osmotically-inducible protein OsmY